MTRSEAVQSNPARSGVAARRRKEGTESARCSPIRAVYRFLASWKLAMLLVVPLVLAAVLVSLGISILATTVRFSWKWRDDRYD